MNTKHRDTKKQSYFFSLYLFPVPLCQCIFIFMIRKAASPFILHFTQFALSLHFKTKK